MIHNFRMSYTIETDMDNVFQWEFEVEVEQGRHSFDPMEPSSQDQIVAWTARMGSIQTDDMEFFAFLAGVTQDALEEAVLDYFRLNIREEDRW